MTSSTANRGDYEAIPDVEVSAVVIGDDPPSRHPTTPTDGVDYSIYVDDDDEENDNCLPRDLPTPQGNLQELYPQANALEAQCLGYLDEIIQLPTPQVKLPRLQVKHLQPTGEDEGRSSSVVALIKSLQLPTVILVASLTLAGITLLSSSIWLQKLFPYLAFMAGFLGMVPPMMGRFTQQSDRAFDVIDTTQAKINDRVDRVTQLVVEGYVEKIQDMVDQVLEPMRPKWDQLTKAEVLINKILEPDIDIPDPKDIERQLDGCADAIKTKMELVKNRIQVTPYIPFYLRSKENMKRYIIYPSLALFILLQLIGVYQSVKATAAASGSVESSNMGSTEEFLEDDTVVTPHLRGTLEHTLSQANETLSEWVSNYNHSSSNDTISNSTKDGTSKDTIDWYYPFWVSLQAYLITVVELVLVFLSTETIMIVAILNTMIAGVNDDASRALEETGTAQVFEKYLTEKMKVVKDKLLNLITKMNKIETALKLAGIDHLDDIDSMAGWKSLDDLKGAAMTKFGKLVGVGKGLNEAKDKAQAKADAAKDKLHEAKGKMASFKDKFGSWGK